jgi:Beta-ketoacyl synthase, N-terminal domain
MPDFVLRDWCAWSPGSIRPGASFSNHKLIVADMIAIPSAVPKLLHRRLGSLAKAVFTIAGRCLESEQTLPVVFSSTHGEICKSLEMLEIIQTGEDLSPTAFSLSVHNAIAGLFSIAFTNREEITVIAPCREGIHAAFVEGVGQLQEGINEVLLILYDEPIADFYPHPIA